MDVSCLTKKIWQNIHFCGKKHDFLSPLIFFQKISKNTPITQEEIYSNFQYTKALALTGKALSA
jgi:hypothetical protein